MVSKCCSGYYLVALLQLPYGLGRDEGCMSCVLHYTTHPAGLLLNPARIPPDHAPPHPDDARPMVRRPTDLPGAAGYDRAWARTQGL